MLVIQLPSSRTAISKTSIYYKPYCDGYMAPAGKRDLTTFAISVVLDQPALPRSLIRAYDARYSVAK